MTATAERARAYLAAYDAQLRTGAETPSALSVRRLGPLRLVTFAAGRGFVTYQHLAGADADTITDWVGQALAHYRADPEVVEVEWKTRGHDRAPGLAEALTGAGFKPGDTESIMIGEARDLAVDVAPPARSLPDGLRIRTVRDEPGVRAMCAMQAEVFGDHDGDRTADALLRRLGFGDGMQLWVAEVGGGIAGAGRLEPVAGAEFAGIWGGATRPEWRGRGIYRALTAARARAALALGKTLINSDSTEYSRPILERSGLLTVSTTTPYVWTR